MKAWIPIAVVGLVVAAAAPAGAWYMSSRSIAGELVMAARKSDLQRLERSTDAATVIAGLKAARPGDDGVEAYATPKGIRGVLRKCDPRVRSERALRTAPETAMTSEVVDQSVVVMRCAAPNGGEVRVTVRRTGFTDWRIVTLELPAA